MIPTILTDKQTDELTRLVKGEVYTDYTTRLLYSTDASAYRELPAAVVRPLNETDVESIILFAAKHKLPIIPRGAGTSLAGQVVGNGIVVDVSKHLNKIVELNVAEKWVIVEPGVVLDELNLFLKSHLLFFGPETSTSNRCNIGGMVGNNSCGSHSLVYGSTRDHLLEVTGFLSNGDKVTFNRLSVSDFQQKCIKGGLEGEIYQQLNEILSNPTNQNNIRSQYPHPDIKRRNTGYALDLLMQTEPFADAEEPFDMCKLIAGSEGTLMFMTQIKLNLVPLPPAHNALVCVHFTNLKESVKANNVALTHQPVAIELMDKLILDLTKKNIQQNKNRFFIEGDPASLLLVEFAEESKILLDEKVTDFITDFQSKQLGYSHPVLYGKDINRVWSLRKAGLGVLSNMPGDELPVPVIEDTAIRPIDMPAYVEDIQSMLAGFGKDCVFYAHIGTGELHLRPVLNMKNADDLKLFRMIATETAKIVKKYQGSLSGEHGDGRLRGEFISFMLGDENYQLLKKVKNAFDPHSILNPGKIVDTPPMDSSLRYNANVINVIEPVFRWDKTGGIVQGADKCTGSADCRKSSIIGGSMCPSFMATRNELDSTRARANVLREFFTGGLKVDSKGLDEAYKVLDLCLSCKACKAECPSNIDMAKLKAEFLNYYHSQKGITIRERFFAYQPTIFKLASKFSRLFNSVVRSKWLMRIVTKVLRLNPNIKLPKIANQSLIHWHENRDGHSANQSSKKVSLFADEFTIFSDEGIGQTAIKLLEALGYQVFIPQHIESGRTYLSKGFLKNAKAVANENVMLLRHCVTAQIPLIGIEPSAILTFRDEYPELVSDHLKDDALQLAQNSFTIEEFLWREMEAGRIQKDQFSEVECQVQFHGHCYQKALSDTSVIQRILAFPANYHASEIQSGCCGKAGSFGYEAEHVEISKQIGELKLFPAVRNKSEASIIAASGMSCRQHIFENTGVNVKHPVEVLYEALKF